MDAQNFFKKHDKKYSQPQTFEQNFSFSLTHTASDF